jgi:hypothetical protein
MITTPQIGRQGYDIAPALVCDFAQNQNLYVSCQNNGSGINRGVFSLPNFVSLSVPSGLKSKMIYIHGVMAALNTFAGDNFFQGQITFLKNNDIVGALPISSPDIKVYDPSGSLSPPAMVFQNRSLGSQYIVSWKTEQGYNNGYVNQSVSSVCDVWFVQPTGSNQNVFPSGVDLGVLFWNTFVNPVSQSHTFNSLLIYSGFNLNSAMATDGFIGYYYINGSDNLVGPNNYFGDSNYLNADQTAQNFVRVKPLQIEIDCDTIRLDLYPVACANIYFFIGCISTQEPAYDYIGINSR